MYVGARTNTVLTPTTHKGYTTMTIYSYKTLISEAGTPYLSADHSYHVDDRHTYNTPDDIAEFIQNSLDIQHCAEEYLYVLCFDTCNHLIGCFEASHGNVNTSIVSNREIMQKSLLIGAVKIALTHNHPADDLSPSDLDIQATKTVKEACKTIGIKFLDHIIVARSGYYSMKTQGEL